MHRLLLLVVATLLGCKPQSPDYFGTVTPKHSRDMLVLNNGSEPEWIDPGKCSDSTGGEIIFNLFAGLAQTHPQTLQPMPDIAERWELSGDGKIYTFYLRDTVWSDGTKLTARDFEWSWKRVLDPDTQSKYSSIMFALQNARAFTERAIHVVHQADIEGMLAGFAIDRVEHPSSDEAFVFVGGDDNSKAALRHNVLTMLKSKNVQAEITTGDVVGVRALSDHVLEVRLQNPVPYFLSLVAYHTFMPVPRHVLEALTARHLNSDLWTRPEYIVSNGAYQLKEWKFRQYLILQKNPKYWDAQHVRITTIKLLEIESYVTALNMYRAGELDWIGSNTSLPSEFMEHLSKYKDFRQEPHLAVYFYWLNTKKPPLDDVRVRRALSMAIDRNAIVKYVTKSGQIPSADLVPDGLAGYEGLKTPLFEPEKARRLLADAGYLGGKNFPQVTLIYNTSEGHKQIAEAAQQMWKKELGINIDIENREWKVFLSDMALRNFHMARMGWVGDYADPNTFLHDILASYAGNNQSGWQDKNYDALLQKANEQSDPKKRLVMLRQVEKIALDAQPLIPIYVYTRSTVAKPYVKGMWSNYQDKHPYKYFWIDERWYHSIPNDTLPDPAPMIARSN
jgi:oligopeptide transport system substrate-binding protein